MGNQGSFGHGVIGGESGEMSSRPDRARATLSGGRRPVRAGPRPIRAQIGLGGRGQPWTAGAALDRVYSTAVCWGTGDGVLLSTIQSTDVYSTTMRKCGDTKLYNTAVRCTMLRK